MLDLDWQSLAELFVHGTLRLDEYSTGSNSIATPDHESDDGQPFNELITVSKILFGQWRQNSVKSTIVFAAKVKILHP